MDKTNTKTPLSLDQILSSYNLLIIFLTIFIVLVLFLFNVNRKGFNAAFGYEIFITGPILLLVTILIKELITFKNTPDKSWLSSFAQSKESWFVVAVSLSIILIGLAGFFSMLAIGGVFSDSPPENNTSMLMNFILIIVFVAITGFIYSNSKEKDETTLKSFPKQVQDIFALRTKYTLGFVAFIMCIVVLYLVNPWNIMSKYGGPIVFFTLFIGIIMVIMITLYQHYIADPSKANMFNNAPSFISYLVKGTYILGSIFISGFLLYQLSDKLGLFEQDASKPESWGRLIFNIALLCGMLAMIYKLANAGGFLDKNPLYRLILSILFYIPCLMVNKVNMLVKIFGLVSGAFSNKPKSNVDFSSSQPDPFEIKMLILGVSLLGGYFFWTLLGKPYVYKKYLKQGGIQLINQPIQTDKLTSVTTYQQLYGEQDDYKFDYQYAMSFWIYLDAFPPSTSSAYLKVVPLMSYGNNPTIKYSAKDNTLFITVKEGTEEDIRRAHILSMQKAKSNAKDNEDEFVRESPELNENLEETAEKWATQKEMISANIQEVKSMPFGNDVDAEGNRIIYKHPDVLLQKWNHIVLNYSGGTLDVFYNGKLVKSAIEVVPYFKLDTLTVGSENGIKGNVANLMYFKRPLDILTIHTLYNSLKDKNPPSIPENPETLVPLPKK